MTDPKMRVLDLVESGTINADEAAKLLQALGSGSKFISKESKDNIEEKLQTFAKDLNKAAKDLGGKVQVFYKDVEPKLKKASQSALEKAACALDNLAQSINESLEKQECNCTDVDCNDDDCNDKECDDTPKPN